MGKNSHLYTKDDLSEILQGLVNTEYKNVELRRALTNEYSKRDLSMEKIGALFDGTLKFQSLDNIELIIFSQVCHTILKSQSLSEEELEKFFSKSAIEEAKNMKIEDKEKITQCVFDNMLKIDGSNYVGRISFEQIYKYFNNGLLRYNKKSQRKSNVKDVGTLGNKIREISINEKHVKEIGELMLNNEFEENQIILNVLLKEKNNPNYSFIPRDGADDIIGTLIITPNTTDVDSAEYTQIDILDGFHRIMGVMSAVGAYLAETGKYLEGGLDLRVVFRTLEDARKIVRQTFKRSDTDADYLEGMDKNNYTDIIDIISKKSKVLKDKVGLDYDDCIVEGALTYRTILAKALKEYSNLDVNSVRIREIGTKQIAKTIDDIILYIKEIYFDNSMEKMKSESNLLDINIFIGYLAVAVEIYKKKLDNVFEVAEQIYLMSKDNMKQLNLNGKKCNIQLIYDTFDSIVVEEQ